MRILSIGIVRASYDSCNNAEFLPHVDEWEAVEALGKLDGACVGGEALDTLLDQIERFLMDKVQQPDANGG